MNHFPSRASFPRLTVHGVHGLESHNLGSVRVRFLEKFSQVSNIVVAKDELLGAAVPDPLDHGGVVTSVRVNLNSCKR